MAGGTELHTAMEVPAAFLALMVGSMALVRFYVKESNSASNLSALIPWSWAASRLILSTSFLLCHLAWRPDVISLYTIEVVFTLGIEHSEDRVSV